MDVQPVIDLNNPIQAAEFSAWVESLGPWLPDAPTAPVGLAVSGGADSLALAWLARRWRQHVLAFIVDHALRPESAAEARLTAQRLSEMGVEARVLTLAPFPKGRLQERARDARFDALERACADAGCLDLLVAHHLHDQDETVSMRYGAGSGQAGLAGIAASTIRGRIRIVRPLLACHPERLRGTLRAAGLSWVEDPSNQNRRFERVRWRQDLTQSERTQAREWQASAVLNRALKDAGLADLLANEAVWHPAGWVFLRKNGVCEGSVSALVRLVSGGRYRPSREKVLSLIKQGQGSLGGVIMRAAGRFGNGVIFVREMRSVEASVCAAGQPLWDGRWRCLQEDVPEGTLIGALGSGAQGLDARRLGIPVEALQALPALWRDGCVIGLPDLLERAGTVPFAWAGGVPVTGENGVNG
ncbi:tRNA lysidine(34) synthetase TilS [Gluconobacter sp. Gdi]|uniref:tRNA lysidine(34) synthetase TilS n=1 Tax=Gluconobacter sp. Gdi TaxID=2691888 RepID=UPI00177480F3|nr:tRNA lysidine(34) synthetase TilS [Gluconobacter sp. Gdi]GFE95248.1 tRNA(Ile)-lysidine synthase [Gluconobacter sp. Gdi]